MRKLIPITLAMLLFPAAGYSLGLGEIRLHSALNQPLAAEIDLLSVGADDAASIRAGLASSDLFAQLGIDRTANLLLVQFDVAKRRDGSYYVKVTSTQPMREPYLDFLLEVNWKSGRAMREYTVLLDPPEFTKHRLMEVQPPAFMVEPPAPDSDGALPAEGEAATEAVPEQAQAVDTETTGEEPAADAAVAAAPVDEMEPSAEQAAEAAPAQNAEAEAEAETTAAPEEAAPAAETEEMAVAAEPMPEQAGAPAKSGIITYGPVRGDETLWAIAKRVRPDRSSSLPQVMTALVRENPYAFYGNNANRLKAGQVLRLDPTLLAEISREEATREMAMQGREWEDYKQRVAAQAGSRASGPVAESQNSGAVVAAKKDEPRLKLVAPEADGKADKGEAAAPGTGAKEADAVRKELMLAIETTEAQKQENQDLRKRLQELEGQLNSMQRLLTLKDNDLAALQQQAARAGETGSGSDAKGTVPTQPPAVATASQPEVAPVPATTSSTPTADPAAGAITAQTPETGAAAPAPSDAATPEKSPAAKTPPKKAPTPPPPAPEPSFLSGLLDNAMFLGIAAFSVLLIGVAVFLAVRRRNSGASFQESILMGSPSMLKHKAAEAAPHKEETSFFSDFAVSGMGDIHTEDSEVDPLTEADVYMAYQRYQQAEELLRDAMKGHDRPELHAKLLEVFHATRDSAAFEAEAVRFNQMVNGKGPLWDKVAALGHELLPTHTLFAEAPTKVAAGDASHTEARLDNDVLDIGLDLDALAEEMESGGHGNGGEFNLDLGVDFSDLESSKPAAKSAAATAAPKPAPAAKMDEPLEFDLGDLSLDAAPAAAAPAKSSEPSFDLGSLDIGELDVAPSKAPAAKPAPAEPAGLDLGELDLSQLELNSAKPAPAAKAAPAVEAIELSDLDNLQIEGAPDGDDDALFANLDEAGTKLDLARAYIEMGDADGARGILDEVVQEGNPNQKQQAQDLLRQMA